MKLLSVSFIPCLISVILAFHSSSFSKELSDSLLRLPISIRLLTLNNLSPAPEDSSVVLNWTNRFHRDIY